MNRKYLIFIAIQAFIIVILFWLLVFYGRDEYENLTQDEEEAIETPSLVQDASQLKNGVAAIKLNAVSQKEAGIVTALLESSSHQNETETFGTVLNIDSLFDLRARYQTALSEVTIAQSTIPSIRQTYQRYKLLNEDDKNISDQALAEVESSLKQAESRLYAAKSNALALSDTLRSQWGPAFTNVNSDLMMSLVNRQRVLLQISFPVKSDRPNQYKEVTVSPVGSPSTNVKAQFLSIASKADSTIAGNTYLFTAPAEQLRAGMRIVAELNSGKNEELGVVIPDRAVVWYANKAWVYQKEGSDTFVRKEISTEIEANNEGDNGWFNRAPFKAGDQVVINGAQLLLSEEFKSQITNENDD